MSERTKAAQDILPADHPACAELHCPPPQLAPDKQRLASKITSCKLARGDWPLRLNEDSRRWGIYFRKLRISINGTNTRA